MPHPDSRPTPEQTRAEQNEKLRHFRHLLDDEHFAFYTDRVAEIVRREHDAALDESLTDEVHRRHLARYHMAKEIADLAASQEKALSSVLGNRPMRGG